MTIQKTESELRRAQLVKVARSRIRLEYSLMADAVLNDILPEIELEFDKALKRGRMLEASDIEGIVKGALNE